MKVPPKFLPMINGAKLSNSPTINRFPVSAYVNWLSYFLILHNVDRQCIPNVIGGL